MCVCACVCVCVCACARACVCACVRAFVRARGRVCIYCVTIICSCLIFIEINDWLNGYVLVLTSKLA